MKGVGESGEGIPSPRCWSMIANKAVRLFIQSTPQTWRSNPRKNAETEPKQKQHPAVDVTGDGSKSDAVKSNIA